VGRAVLGVASLLGLQSPCYLGDLDAAGLAEDGQQDHSAAGREPVGDQGLLG
jgi:hypothetical protein